MRVDYDTVVHFSYSHGKDLWKTMRVDYDTVVHFSYSHGKKIQTLCSSRFD